jgi:hypothetical protein
MARPNAHFECKRWTYRLAVVEAMDSRYHAAVEFWPPGQKVDSYTALTLHGRPCDTEREAMVLGTRAAERGIDRQALLGR